MTNEPLADAEFVLSRTETVINEETGEESTVTQYVIFTAGALSGWTEDINEATTLTSGEDGYVHLTGLAAGTYTLTETKAPDGYITPEEEESIEIILPEEDSSRPLHH